MNNELIIFTESFPYQPGETFLEPELPYLAASFDRVVIIPRLKGSGLPPHKLPENVICLPPIMGSGLSPLTLICRGLFNRASLRPLLTAFSSEQPFAGWWRFRSWLYVTLMARLYLSQLEVKRLCSPAPGRLLYFYWGTNALSIIPFLDRNCRARAVSRFHSIDLYEERVENRGYIPLQRRLLERIDAAVAISSHGFNHLLSQGVEPGKVFLHRLGVTDAGLSHPSTDGIFRIVSCSAAIPVKRLHLIVEALGELDQVVEWTHIGDGPLMEELKSACTKLPANITCRFLGQIKNTAVRQIYRENPCDLFLNVSRMEGVPVSIMEALSAGMPVMATAVGGTSELVDVAVGKLLPPAIDGHHLARDIIQIRERILIDGDRMRQVARARWAEHANAAKVFDCFARFLVCQANMSLCE